MTSSAERNALDMVVLLRRNEARMREVRARVAVAAQQAVLRHAGRDGSFGPAAMLMAMQDIQAAMAAEYGAFPGDPRARLLGVIDEGTREARDLAIRRMSEDSRAILGERRLREAGWQ